MNGVERVAEVLGGQPVLRASVRTWLDLERLVQAGLPKRALQHVARHAVGPDEPINELVYRVVPAATFKRRTRLSAEESQRTERLARVIALAESIWEDPAASRYFLNRPHPLLGNETPLDAAQSELGARRVERLLYDVEHGLPL